MARKSRAWHECDLCSKEIRHYAEGSGDAVRNQFQAANGYEWQLWPTDDGNLEICGPCFTLFARAHLMGLVELKGIEL